MSEAQDKLDAAVRDYFGSDLVTGWALVAHRVATDDEPTSPRSVVRVAMPGQDFHITRGLLDVALTSERMETRDRRS